MPAKRDISIHLLVHAAVLLPLALACTALALLATFGSSAIAERLGVIITQNGGERVSREVGQYLSDAVQTAEIYAHRLDRGDLSIDDLSTWKPVMFDDLRVMDRVASICIGLPDGRSTWLLRGRNGLELGESFGDARATDAIEFPVLPDGEIVATPIREYKYDPRIRPWYQLAVEAPEPTWTPVYFWFGESGVDSTTGTGFTRRIENADGSLAGVLVIDVTLRDLSAFLESLPMSQYGVVYIVDEQGMLVAASKGPVNTDDGQRMPLQNAPAPATLAAAALSGDGEVTQTIDLGHELARLNTKTMSPWPGIQWQIVTVLPESSFLAQAKTVQRRLAMLGLIAIALAGIGAFFVARRLVDPLVRLTEHVRAVGEGELDVALHLHGARELEFVSQAINDMTAGLKQRMEMELSLDLASEVQQSLLPADNPTCRLLDVCGRSHYCDSTGGDYFDFHQLSAWGEDSLLVVVGDVMGHGVAAALLMASARGALHANCHGGESLDAILDSVNTVLTAGNRHYRFMTMALVLLDPDAGSVRWASAGHDPPYVYDPKSDTFRELEGGGIPLGFIDGTPYEEYAADDLQPGQILVVGTDGIWESHQPDLEMFGKERLQAIVRENHHRSAAEIANAIEASLAAFMGDTPAKDDVTFVLAKVLSADSARQAGDDS